MIFEQFYLECLSHASYLIGDTSTGRAVVVDPQRDVQQYLDSAKSHDLKIELVLETHFHADFLSGHLELAKATGATIGYGAVAKPQFAARAFTDGERYVLGEVAIRPSLFPSWCSSTRTTKCHMGCSQATRCLSAMLAGPTCWYRLAKLPTSWEECCSIR